MKRTTYQEKAEMCLKLMDYYKANASTQRDYILDSNDLGKLRVKGVAKLNLPNISIAQDAEQDLLNQCHFGRYVYANRVISGSASFDGGVSTCDTCGPFWSSVVWVGISQKISDDTYAAQSKVRVQGMHVTASFRADKTVVIKSTYKLEKGNTVIFGLYSGHQRFDKLDGFESNLPVLFDVGPQGVSALIVRFMDLRNQLYKDHPGKVKCGYFPESNSGFQYVRFGCYPKKASINQFSEVDGAF